MNYPPTTEFEPILTLTECQYRVFLALGQGLSTKEIAAMPGHLLSVKTIETHMLHLKERLGLSNRDKLIALSARYQAYCDFAGLVRVPNKPPKFAWKLASAV